LPPGFVARSLQIHADMRLASALPGGKVPAASCHLNLFPPPYEAGAAAREKLADTYLGKTLLVTGHKAWTDAQVIRAYRSQFVIEEIFHEMKGRHIGAWWPLHHWTDSKIQVHGLYCTLAVLLRALVWRRAQQAGLRLSMAGLLDKLGQIRQVVNVYPARRGGRPGAEQAGLTQRDEAQTKLIQILGLELPK
jgi:hypothetical protein